MAVVLPYDLKNLLTHHPAATRMLLAPAISRLGGGARGQIQIRVERRVPFRRQRDVVISWDLGSIATDLNYPSIVDDLRRLEATDESPDERTMRAAEVVAMVVMHLLNGSRFTGRAPRSRRNRPTFADFYMNDAPDSMVEVAGRVSDDLGRLFELKRKQILRNPTLSEAWVSVTVFDAKGNATGRVRP